MLDSCGNGLVDSVADLVNDRGINNLLYGVDLVGLWNWVRLGHFDGVGLLDVGLVDNLSFDWDWVWDWDIDWYPLDVEFWLDASHHWSDLGVGTNWGSNDLLEKNVGCFKTCE